MIYLDTHVVVWLYGLGVAAVPEPVLRAIDAADELRISPMVRLELQYLYEIERVAQPALEVLDGMQATLGLAQCDAPFAAVVQAAQAQRWTRDPFDRLIVAQASLYDAPLITKDEQIHIHYPHACWE